MTIQVSAESVVLTIVDSDGEQEANAAPATDDQADQDLSSRETPPESSPVEAGLDEPDVLEWEVTISKNDNELGIDVLQHERDRLRVNKIKFGSVLIWNQHHPAESVKPGDHICSVNGQTGTSENLIGLIRSSQELVLGMRRTLWLRVEITREEGGPLGIDVSSSHRHLRILHIREGPFLEWNDKVSSERRVSVHDQILEVNGTRGTSDELLQAIRSAGTVINFRLKASGRLESQHGGCRPRPELTMPEAGEKSNGSLHQQDYDVRNEPPEGHTTLIIN